MIQFRLYDNWKTILKQAWSIRFALIAGVLSGCEVALPYLSDRFPPTVFALLAAVFCCAAFVARLVAQKGV